MWKQRPKHSSIEDNYLDHNEVAYCAESIIPMYDNNSQTRCMPALQQVREKRIEILREWR